MRRARTGGAWSAMSLVALLVLSLAALPAAAQPVSSRTEAIARVGIQVSAGICTLIYTPIKVAYAAAAIPVGGLVWVWSVGDAKMAGRVIRAATRGDFVVVPAHLKREQPLDFVGKAERDAETSNR